MLKRLNRGKGHDMSRAKEPDRLIFKPASEEEKAIYNELLNIPIGKCVRPEKKEETDVITIVI